MTYFKRHNLIIFLCFFLIIVATGCEGITEKEDNNTPLDNSTLLAEIPAEKLALYGINPDQGESKFVKYLLQSDSDSKEFQWGDSMGPDDSWAPQMSIHDFNNDGSSEIVIILTSGHGTGALSQEVHVLKKDTLQEIEVQPYSEILEENISMETFPDRYVLSNETEHFIINKDEFPYLDKTDFFDLPALGSVIKYEVIDNTLTLSIAIQISITDFYGDIIIQYEYTPDDRIALNSISFKNE